MASTDSMLHSSKSTSAIISKPWPRHALGGTAGLRLRSDLFSALYRCVIHGPQAADESQLPAFRSLCFSGLCSLLARDHKQTADSSQPAPSVHQHAAQSELCTFSTSPKMMPAAGEHDQSEVVKVCTAGDLSGPAMDAHSERAGAIPFRALGVPNGGGCSLTTACLRTTAVPLCSFVLGACCRHSHCHQ